MKTEAAAIVKLSVGESVEGVLIDMQVKDLYSPLTKDTRPTRMYHFRDPDTQKRFIVTGRAGLDDQFDEMALSATGKTTEEPGGIDALRNQVFLIERAEDIRTNAGQPFGQYELSWLESD